MKLSPEQILFINTYLKNSEIEFVDVRMEMVDHVASEVEHKMQAEKLDFYNAFKNYMITHKKGLLNQNKQFAKTTDIKVLKAIGKFFIKPTSILIFMGCFLVLKVVSKYIVITDFLRFSPIAICIFIGIYYYFVVLRFGKKNRYSGIERMSFILLFVTQFLQIFFNPSYQISFFENYETVNMLFVSSILVLALGFIETLIKFKKEYTNRFNNKFV